MFHVRDKNIVRGKKQVKFHIDRTRHDTFFEHVLDALSYGGEKIGYPLDAVWTAPKNQVTPMGLDPGIQREISIFQP